MLRSVGGVLVVATVAGVEAALRAVGRQFTSVPAESLARAVTETDPDLVVISPSEHARIPDARRGRPRIIASYGAVADVDHVIDPGSLPESIVRLVELLARLGAAEDRALEFER